MYTHAQITAYRNQALLQEYTEYCNVLSSEIFSLIYPGETKHEHLLTEYDEAPLLVLEQELKKSGVAFVELANSSGQEKTFIHEFVLFVTEEGVYRVESYGLDEVLKWNEETRKVDVLPGYVLYKGKITLWNDWRQNLQQLTRCKSGPDRLRVWNDIFSAQETQDQNEAMEMVLYLPYEQTF